MKTQQAKYFLYVSLFQDWISWARLTGNLGIIEKSMWKTDLLYGKYTYLPAVQNNFFNTGLIKIKIYMHNT